MKAYEIMTFAPVNETDEANVQAIAESIRENGWVGCPILVSEAHGLLITGSHRLAALMELDDEGFDIDDLGDVAEVVDDIIDDWCELNDTCIDDIRGDFLSDLFEGTWVEEYKDETEEW